MCDASAAETPTTIPSIKTLQVEVRGVEGELKAIAESCIAIRPNFSYSLQEVKEDARRVFDSGYFERLDPRTDDTRDGVKLIFNVSAPCLQVRSGEGADHQAWVLLLFMQALMGYTLVLPKLL